MSFPAAVNYRGEGPGMPAMNHVAEKTTLVYFAKNNILSGI